MTLVEVLIALTIFGVIVTAALSFMSQQNTAFQTAVDRMGALRNVRYAVTLLAQDLETLGTNVPGQQPSLVYADSSVITFAADYATNVANDPFAVFYTPGAPNGQVRAPAAADTFVIPTTSVVTPDTVYLVGPGVMSPAELISFYFQADGSTSRNDDYALFRQVNGGTPEVVARQILRLDNEPFFAYEREVLDTLGDLHIQDVARSELPIHHSVAIHLSQADTGALALADSVRAVRISLRGSNGLSGDEERLVDTQRRIVFPNAGAAVLSTCGSAPLYGDTITATATTLAGGEAAIDLEWVSAVDEGGGEADVVRYVLWRRANGSSDWGEPFVAIPAGDTVYTYQDATVESGNIYEFGLAAQDCTPTLSALVSTGLVTVP